MIFVRSPSRIFRKITILSTVSTMNTRRFVKRAVHFYDFDRSERFSDEKSSFFRSCSELPRVDDPSRSEAENHCFSVSTSSPLTFRDIFVIFVRSPSRIFRTNRQHDRQADETAVQGPTRTLLGRAWRSCKSHANATPPLCTRSPKRGSSVVEEVG